MQAHLARRTEALRLLAQRVRRPGLEHALDDAPRRLERSDELGRAARMTEIVLPAYAVRIAERRRLRARLLENVTEPEHSRAREMRHRRPDGHIGRDRELQLGISEVLDRRDERGVLEVQA